MFVLSVGYVSYQPIMIKSMKYFNPVSDNFKKIKFPIYAINTKIVKRFLCFRGSLANVIYYGRAMHSPKKLKKKVRHLISYT